MVGTLVTYLAKNEEARKTTERFVDGVGASFTDFLHRVTPERASKPTEADAEPERTVAEKPKPAKARRAARPKPSETAEKPVH